MTAIVRLRRPVHRRFVWLLPLWFVIGSVIGSTVAGHNGHLFFIGALAGVWACAMVEAGEASLCLVPTLLGGVPLLLLLGWLLDRLGAELALWIFAVFLSSGLAGYMLLQGHGDFDAAIAHHGSILAYVICALQLGSYAATLIVLALQAGRGGRDFA